VSHHESIGKKAEIRREAIVMLSAVFEQLVEQSPVSAMIRGLMERTSNQQQLDQHFEKWGKLHYIQNF
jgi:hypothetical protein